MIIAVGCDHAGYEPPEGGYVPALVAFLEREGHRVIHCGTRGSESVDYPDFAARVCRAILSGEAERGVLLCGTQRRERALHGAADHVAGPVSEGARGMA